MGGTTAPDMVVTDVLTAPRTSSPPSQTDPPPEPPWRRFTRRVRDLPPAGSVFWPALFAVLNGLAFYLVRPGVNDLWAARARASAVTHGVGLFYWFSWFGGGSAPGNYSILTPYLCAAVGTELVAALAAAAVSVLVWFAVRGTARPAAATCCGVIVAAFNLWSGRVPFLLGAAFGVGVVVAIRRRRRWATVALALLTVAASPVAGAFVALGLAGVFRHGRMRRWRSLIALAAGTVLLVLLMTTLVFGAPGPEPYPFLLAVETLAGLALAWFARPDDHVRTTICLTALAVVVVFAVPNGMGANLARFVWFCLPVLVLASSVRRLRVVALLVAPLLVVGGVSTASDLLTATRPVSSAGYYEPLAQRLDHLSGLQNYRVEVVDHGARAAYDALLGHAALARGWETQEDMALNAPLLRGPLDAATYRAWLHRNAVGYVAVPTAAAGRYPEYRLVLHRPPYLRLIWADAEWRLFRVDHATPVVSRPGKVLQFGQSAMTVRVPCACRLAVRLRYSRYLAATLLAQQRDAVARPTLTAPTHTAPTVTEPPVTATLTATPTGWTSLTAPRPGVYVLHGSAAGLLH